MNNPILYLVTISLMQCSTKTNTTLSEQFKNTTLSEQFKNTTLSKQFKNTTLSKQFKNTTLSEQFKNLIKISRNRCKFDTPNTHIHDNSFSWFGTDTLIKKLIKSDDRIIPVI